MKTRFIKCTIAGIVQGEVGGREILIRADMIAAVTQYAFIDNSHGSIKQYWTAKIIMTSGKEISLQESYDSIIKEWTEASLYG